MNDIVLHAFNGLSQSSILLLISLGLAFSFGLMNVINMAHGEFIMVGAYVTYLLDHYLSAALGGADRGLWFVLSIPASFVVAGLVGMLLEVSLIRFLYGRPLDTLLSTWGVGLVLQQAARSIFGAPNVQVSSPSFLRGGVALSGGLQLPYKRVFLLGLVLFCLASVYVYLYRSGSGLRLRAVMQNREMASCLGVRSRRVDAATFALGAGLAGVAGCALTQIGSIGPSLGTNYLVDAFMVVILGGLGRLLGTVAAALLIGISNTLLELGTTASLGKVLVFVLVTALLQWRPKGLFTPSAR
jgi:urea transport system permease protein